MRSAVACTLRPGTAFELLVTVLEAVQSLSRDIAGGARREKGEEHGCDPTLPREEGGISRGRESGELLRATDRERRKRVCGLTRQVVRVSSKCDDNDDSKKLG